MSTGPARSELNAAARRAGVEPYALLGGPRAWAAAAVVGATLVAGCPKGGGPTSASKEDPNVKAVRTQMGYIDSQIRVFAATNHRAPTPDQGLPILFNGETPKDPWANPILYIVPGPNGSAFDLMSYGADGAPGGKGEGADLLWSALKP